MAKTSVQRWREALRSGDSELIETCTYDMVQEVLADLRGQRHWTLTEWLVDEDSSLTQQGQLSLRTASDNAYYVNYQGIQWTHRPNQWKS